MSRKCRACGLSIEESNASQVVCGHCWLDAMISLNLKETTIHELERRLGVTRATIRQKYHTLLDDDRH